MDTWNVLLTSSARKAAKKLPSTIDKIFQALLAEIKKDGPVRKNWPHFSSLGKRKNAIPDNAYHCHLKQGKPTYVACWAVEDKNIKIVEIFYVGTHENAPY